MVRRALIGLGTNLPFEGVGGPALLAQALAALEGERLAPLACSSAWASPAWPDGSGQPAFTNAVAKVDAGEEAPEALYAKLLAIEARFGRERRERWGPRTLDLDILDLEGFAGEYGPLTLPHGRLHERAFVLLPLAEVAPGWRHLTLEMSVGELVERLGPTEGTERLGPLRHHP